MKQQFCKFGNATLIVAVFGSALSATAGSLTPPPGPIQPTNRGQLNQQFGGLPIVITESGSYVLTGNIVAPAGYTGNGIEITADNVTLDLNGFSVIGVAGSGTGITCGPICRNNVVRNGLVLEWGNRGVEFIVTGFSSALLCENVRAINNLGTGIYMEGAGTVTKCVAFQNLLDGIACGGIVSHCRAEGNLGNGISFAANPFIGLKVVSCFAINNRLDGIRGVFRYEVIDCHASENSGYGIRLGALGTVTGSTCSRNGVGSPLTESGGILADDDTVIKGNLLLGNEPNGLEVAGTGNTIIRNVVTESTNNYVIAAGNNVGPISMAADATSPVVNITD